MIVRSPRPAHHFTLVRNDVLRDARLSFKARGLLAYLLSFPDNWRVSAQALARSGPDGYTSVLNGMQELRQAGYVRTVRGKDDAGRFTATTYVYDQPHSEPESAIKQPIVVDSPQSENPLTENPQSENRPIIEDCSKEERVKKTVNTAAQELARGYCEQVPLSNFAGIMGIVRKALNAGYEHPVIAAALTRLAVDGRPVTVNTLRIEMEGMPARSTRRTKVMDEYAELTAWAQEQDGLPLKGDTRAIS